MCTSHPATMRSCVCVCAPHGNEFFFRIPLMFASALVHSHLAARADGPNQYAGAPAARALAHRRCLMERVAAAVRPPCGRVRTTFRGERARCTIAHLLCRTRYKYVLMNEPNFRTVTRAYELISRRWPVFSGHYYLSAGASQIVETQLA